MRQRKILLIYGTRPEAIKLAPVAMSLRTSSTLTGRVIVTGQHRSMLDQVNHLFGIVPEDDLSLITERQTLTDVTVKALGGLTPIIQALEPDAVLVQGDTTTTLAASLAAFYAHIPLVHLEAGLRTHNLYNPFPEEANRRLTSQLTTLHLAPTPAAAANLVREGVPMRSIITTGNTVIDALHWILDKYGRDLHSDPLLSALARDKRDIVLVTLHRRESLGAPLEAVCRAINQVAQQRPDCLIVFPVHKNPAVREVVMPILQGRSNVLIIEPLPYLTFARIMANSRVILTDSGGVQEEGPSLGVPVLVARETTERPEAVQAGTARLVGTDEYQVAATLSELLEDHAAHSRMANAVNPYGDGQATGRVLAALRYLLEGDPRPDEFTANAVSQPSVATG